MVSLLDETQAMISRLRAGYPEWNDATLAVNGWLYFNRNDADEEYQRRLRAFYDELLPTNPLELIYYYTSGRALDIHDPDVSYDPEGDNDHRYGETRIYELVDAAPKESVHFLPLLNRFLEKPTNSAWIAVVHIAKHVDDPECLMKHILKNMIEDGNSDIILCFARGIISGAAQTDKSMKCLDLALSTPGLSASSIELIASVELDDSLMQRAIEYVKRDIVTPHQVSALALNASLQTVDDDLIQLLVKTLLSKQADGAWAAIYFLNRILQE